ncbi:DUF2586 family protein [Mucilaginibacter rubeus]|uniref:DUF2586 family protein n=1 Tax=Mucilaginibacter rubeus TaxID=2027860 RepID=A0A5C1I694_9SPHI|nr:DUF2586 family protein [Mucilaginibacter rubeus]QEM13479.1 hypothetical protein DEO27_026865 [Mucilaginibacter rubeus]
MIPEANVNLANGQIGGSISTNDNLTGYVLTGAGTGILGLLAPIKVISVDDAKAQGVTAEAEPEAYRFVTEFYSIPGTLNAPVWIMLVGAAVSLVDVCNINNENGIKKLINAAQGTIRVLGVARTPAVGYVPTVSKFLDSDVALAVPVAKTFATAMFENHTPLRILIAARVNDVTSVTIDTPKTMTANNVGLVIGGTANDGITSMGLVLGKVASTAPHVCIGKVKDGDLPISSYFIGGLPILQDTDNPQAAWYKQIDQLVDAGFITVKTYPNGSAGFYFSNDPMCVAESDDYANLATGRVIDKASIIAYKVYCNEINDDVDLDDNNNIEPVVLKALEGVTVAALNLNMSASMSGDPVVYVDENQQITATSKFKTKLRIRRKGYLKVIDVELGFYNPNLN